MREYDCKQMVASRAVLALAAVASVGAAVAVPLLWAQATPAAQVGAVLTAATALVVLALAVWRAPRAGLGFELWVRGGFRAVCRQKGLVIKAGDAVRYPLVGQLAGTRRGFRLRIRPLPGQSLADFEKVAAALAMAYGLTGVRFRNDGAGVITMLAGYQPIDAHEFPASAISTSVNIGDASSVSWRELLGGVRVGLAEGGRPYLLPLIDSHTLIAGQTGAGKGSVIWSLLLGLTPAVEAGAVELWGFDPKRMELSVGRELFAHYAADPEAMVELLEAAHDAMQARAAELAGWTRRFEPSPESPLHVIIIDELGYLSALLPDRKLRERAERALSGVLVLGRAVGFTVVGALQDPRKETLSLRDLFPTRVAMRLPKPMVDLVLGSGAYEAGAQCDLIPAREAGAGVAFVMDESSTLPICVRMSWCSDQLIRSVAGRLAGGSAAPRLNRATT